ncbi:hypothetical protein ABZ816_40250 [Actinosynnema sp. NPDC047251]|uniref:Secreted protein n=1 Tax=Saccharothrix espanaensis (strain ATCC 51144 / DSM 44229 / JCM 9112 / NBRC 15066 / NRRL 15764) TaxID=1179773 RepID=K0K1C9_SACES|nr:hypothetical protein [Saccharothrix espanaensis]CCH32126.1 hypothetical protein BN6_48540 [Saccharothrix espanaensis DSM 44229]
MHTGRGLSLIMSTAIAVAAVVTSAATILAPSTSAASVSTRTVADTQVAAQPAAPVYIRHRQSQKCLDGSVSQGVRLNTCNATNYQQWEYFTND